MVLAVQFVNLRLDQLDCAAQVLAGLDRRAVTVPFGHVNHVRARPAGDFEKPGKERGTAIALREEVDFFLLLGYSCHGVCVNFLFS
jgi:hypothetical protein